ncbi:MAG: type II toxin-antitoxin system VapC family toxin, partial [Armatimonadetes bacterium]|nr:type II toxin-antitoxin system VapC family toxin [Armatimonadota bacterium]
LLDTNIVTILFRMQEAMEQNTVLTANMAQVSPEQTVISSITVVEQMQGMVSLVRQFEKMNREHEAHAVMLSVCRFLNRFTIIEFDTDAQARFLRFPAAVRRQGRADCQIAAIAIERDYTVVTQNVRHFAAIPEARFADWTRPGTA